MLFTLLSWSLLGQGRNCSSRAPNARLFSLGEGEVVILE